MDGKKGGGKGRGFEKFIGGKGSRPDGGRPRGDRPQGDRPYSGRPQGDRPYGGRPYGDRPQGDRPYGGRPQGDRPYGDRPQGDRPYGDRPQGDRPYGSRPQGDRPYGSRPQGDRPQGDRPQGGSYAGGKHGGKPGDGRRYFDSPARPYREDGQNDKGPGPRFSKAPERPVPPAVYEDGNRPKPEGAQSDRPRYSRPTPRFTRPDQADRPAPRYNKPEQSDSRAPRYGRPAPKFVRPDQSDNHEPRYGRPAPKSAGPGQSDNHEPRYGRPAPKSAGPGQSDSYAPRYGRPAPKFARPGQSDSYAPRYGRPAPKFARPGQSDNHEPRYGRPIPKPEQPDVVSESAETESAEMDNLLVGRNPIREALKAGRSIEKMLVAQGELSGSAKEIVAKAKEAGIVVQFVDRARLDAVYQNHQGMLAYLSAAAYQTLDDILALAQSKDEAPFIVALDGVTDPHNLGAIIRSAECCGAHGVIIPERRSAGLNPAAVKAAAGALTYLPVAKVGNLSRTLAELKEKGLWVIGCDMSGSDILKADLTGSVVVVIGSEGEGVSRLVLEGCDRVVSIPLKGQIASLNASVAAGIALYEVMRTRSGQ